MHDFSSLGLGVFDLVSVSVSKF